MTAADFPERFRMSLPWLLAELLAVVWGVQAVMVAAGWATGLFPPSRAGWLVLGLQLAAGTAGCAGAAVARWWSVGVRVGPAGLALDSAVSRPLVVRWEDVLRVRQARGLLTPRLVVERRGSRLPLVLPLRLADPAGFAAAVDRYAPDDSPLPAALAEALGDAG